MVIKFLPKQEEICRASAFCLGSAFVLFMLPEAEGREKKVFAHHMGSLNAGRGAMTWHTHYPELGDPAHSNGGDYRGLPLVPYDLPEMTVEQSADFQIQQAMRIGIDGFAVNAWAGGHEAKEFLDALFYVAEKNDYPFEISICPDPNTVDQPNGLAEAWADAIRYLLDRHGDSPKLARRDGKPIIFGYQSAFIWVEYLEKLYKNDRERIDIARTTPEGWALVGEAYRELERLVGQPLYYQFDMGAFYHGLEKRGVPANGVARAAAVVAQQMPAICEFLPSSATREIARATVDAGAEWGQPIYLNYENPRTPATFGGPGTEMLRKLWGDARESGATLLQLSTWNDYHENTNIAPATNTNYAYFDLTGYFIEWWKTGNQPTPDRDKVYVFGRKYPRWAPMYPFQDLAGSDGVIEVLTILERPGRIKLIGRGEYDAPAGLHWQHFPVTPGNLKAELIRDGHIEIVVRSPEVVTDRPFRQDNAIIGISSEFSRHWRKDFGDLPEYRYSEYGDLDGNGLPNWFEMYWFGYFGDLSTATGVDPDEDVNGDGYTNLEAYLLGRSPIAPPGTQPDPVSSKPFTGLPLAVPGRIEAEFFDLGGPGVAYYDTTPANLGGEFRPEEQVDIERTTDEGGGYNLAWIESGEWLKYTIDVESSGVYDLHVRAARQDRGAGAITVFFDGKLMAESVELPSTGGWQNWQTVVIPGVSLKEGRQTMRIGAAVGWFNLNYIDIVPSVPENRPIASISFPEKNSRFFVGDRIRIATDLEKNSGGISHVEYFAGTKWLGKTEEFPHEFKTADLLPGGYDLTVRVTNQEGMSSVSEPVWIEVSENSVPFHGEPVQLPGRIWAKEYDLGGEGIAYHDSTSENEGNAFRPHEGVDLQPTEDSEGDYNLGWTTPGEWIFYTVQVDRPGIFEISARVASISQNSRFRLEFPGADPIVMEVPQTGGWQRWTTISLSGIPLQAGVQKMRLVSETGDFNLNFIQVQSLGASPVETFSSWRERYFTPQALADESISGPTADPSGNGISNLLSYALNLNPHSTSRAGLPKAGWVAIDGKKYLTLTYTRPIEKSDLIYRVEVSGNLREWESGENAVVKMSITAENGFETVVVRDAQPLKSLTARQIRLRVDRVHEPLSE